jgi:glycopeptide antibiotics resistance protein
MRTLAKVLFVAYSVILVWLILFKFSVHIASVLHYDKRSLNLKPFSSSSGSSGESIDNVLVFIPLGLLLSVNFKRLNFWSKLLVVLGTSVSLEIIQYIFAIGVSDITDVIANALGGLIGLLGYDLSRRYTDEDGLDAVIAVTGSILLGLCVLFLVTVAIRHGVRYRRPG